MKNFRYIEDTATLSLDREACIGCGQCEMVCPHRIFTVENKKASITDRNLCMECGACAGNCPVNAITVTPGVGCAAYIIKNWLKSKGLPSGGSACC